MKKVLIIASLALMAQIASMAPAGASGVARSVAGGGSGTLPSFFGPIAGDTLHVELTARVLPDGRTQGRFHLSHVSKDGGLVADFSGTVSCLVVSGAQASATGTIDNGREADASGFDPSGQTVAITIVDVGTSDRAGVDLSFFGAPHEIGPCAAVPPYLEIDEGNYAVSV